MVISEELIRELQSKVDISYEDAEKYLRKTNGDVNLAAYKYKRRDRATCRFKSTLSRFAKYRFIMTRKNKLLIDLPMWFIILFLLIGKGSGFGRLFWYFIIFIIALIAECEVKVEKRVDDTDSSQYMKTKKKESNLKTQNTTEFTNQEDINNKSKKDHDQNNEDTNYQDKDNQDKDSQDKKDDDYYEIVVED